MWEKTKGWLAVGARDARAAESLSTPCLCLYYRIGEKGILQRAQVSLAGRGGLMGIYEAASPEGWQPDRLARDIQGECARRGFSGVVLDLAGEQGGIPGLDALCAALEKLQVRVFLPEALEAYGSDRTMIIAPTAVSGGTFAQMLDALTARYGAGRLCLDLVRVCSDFPMPAYDPDGKALTPLEFRQLQDTYQPQSFFSPQLCAKYFTYRSRSGGAHFVLFDDIYTAGQKLELICRREIAHVFLLYSEWGKEAAGLLK